MRDSCSPGGMWLGLEEERSQDMPGQRRHSPPASKTSIPVFPAHPASSLPQRAREAFQGSGMEHPS